MSKPSIRDVRRILNISSEVQAYNDERKHGGRIKLMMVLNHRQMQRLWHQLELQHPDYRMRVQRFTTNGLFRVNRKCTCIHYRAREPLKHL